MNKTDIVVTGRDTGQSGYFRESRMQGRGTIMFEDAGWRKRIGRVAQAIVVLISLLMIASCGFQNAIGSQSTSAWVKGGNQPPTTNLKGILNDVHMIDAGVGWAQSWYDDNGTKRYTILRTTDAGVHWKATLTCTPYMDISQGKGAGFETCPSDFRSASVASVLEPEQNNQSRIFHTSDGGQNWQSAIINARHMVAKPMFVDAQHGFVLATDTFPGFDPSSTFMGQQIALYRTADGGQNWQRILSGDAHGSGDAFGTAPLIHDAFITFTDASTGWLSGTSYANNNSSSWLYVTHDAGVTWKQVKALFPPMSFIMWPPKFFNRQDGLLPVLTSGPAPQYKSGTQIYITHDGGKTWTSGASVPFDVTNSEFLDMNHAWTAEGEAQNIFYSTNDGWQHWTKGYMHVTFKHLYSFDFITPLTGWALGDNRAVGLPEPSGGLSKGDIITILKTTDGGKTWQEIAHSTV